MAKKYIDNLGNEVLVTDEGYVFVNGSCICEAGTDEDFDRYSVEVQNGDGYYDQCGKFRKYYKEEE